MLYLKEKNEKNVGPQTQGVGQQDAAFAIFTRCFGRMFYGPGGPYALFAGRDASRALALMSFDPKDLTGNIEGLSESELEVLQDWEYKFMEKYVKVGQLGSKTTEESQLGSEESKKTDNAGETSKDGEDKSQ